MTVDVRTINENFKRKSKGVTVCKVAFGDFGTDTVVDVATLPKNVLITGVTLVVDVPMQGGVTLLTKVGTTTILAAKAASAAADTTYNDSTLKTLKRLGGNLSLTASATPTVGEATVMVEYIEFDRADGYQTSIS